MSDIPDFFKHEVLEKSKEKPVVVDFWAPWCGPCRILGPTLEKLAKTNKGTWRLVKINSDRQPELARRYDVRGIPAVKMFINGLVVAEFVGALPEPAIKRWLDESMPDRGK